MSTPTEPAVDQRHHFAHDRGRRAVLTEKNVSSIADSLRMAMRRGDNELASCNIERKILQAIVAKSAADSVRWINTRTPNGWALSRPLDDLANDLNQGNYVGSTLQAVETEALSRARSALLSATMTLSVPAWIGSIITFFIGLAGLVSDAGFNFGFFAVPVLLGGIGSFGYIALRAGHLAGQTAGPAVGAGLVSLYESVTEAGLRAERIYNQSAASTLSGLGIDANAVNATAISTRLRNYASGAVYIAFGALAIGVLIFVLGAYNGYTTYQACNDLSVYTRCSR